MYTEYMYADSLTHFGIKGQKWGKRNGPPYPLGYEAHSKKEKKLNAKTKIDGKSDTKGSNKKKKHLTEKQKKTLKKVAVGVGAAALTGAAVYAGTKYVKNKKLSEKLIEEAVQHKNTSKARDLADLYKQHPITFDKKNERRELNEKIIGSYFKDYFRAKDRYEAHPTNAGLERMMEERNKLDNFMRDDKISLRKLRKLGSIADWNRAYYALDDL